MPSKLGLYLMRLTRYMWLRATLFSLLGVATALAAIGLRAYIPDGLSTQIGADAVEDVLTIIASSMLSVTTFSLGVAVTAYNWAASNATPRATQLLVEDSITQNVLSTFVGAFLFSLVGIVALRMGAYGVEGRVVLFAATVLVIIVIVATLLRWIGHLTQIGRMSDTLDRVENATRAALRLRLDEPYLGCTPLSDGSRLPHGNHSVYSSTVGYVQHIDIAQLSELATQYETRLAISALPGTFADSYRELVFSETELDDAQQAAIEAAFTVGASRTFEQDPRFGVIVLSEIASRALSPGINDPGTAIEVIGRLVRVIDPWVRAESGSGSDVRYPCLFAPRISVTDVFDDAFGSIARDAAGIREVNVRLQKAFIALARNGSTDVGNTALQHAELVCQRTQQIAPVDDDDVRAVKSLRDQLRHEVSADP